jgi:hypothetical protein
MARYIQFATQDGVAILVEVDEEEVTPPQGVAKAGLLPKRPSQAVASAAATFEEAVRSAVRRNVLAVSEAVGNLSKPPSEVELVFGLKATGEIGNIALAKAGGEANLSVKLTWKAAEQRGE